MTKSNLLDTDNIPKVLVNQLPQQHTQITQPQQLNGGALNLQNGYIITDYQQQINTQPNKNYISWFWIIIICTLLFIIYRYTIKTYRNNMILANNAITEYQLSEYRLNHSLKINSDNEGDLYSFIKTDADKVSNELSNRSKINIQLDNKNSKKKYQQYFNDDNKSYNNIPILKQNELQPSNALPIASDTTNNLIYSVGNVLASF